MIIKAEYILSYSREAMKAPSTPSTAEPGTNICDISRCSVSPLWLIVIAEAENIVSYSRKAMKAPSTQLTAEPGTNICDISTVEPYKLSMAI
jgi:hypothetical protein